MGILPALLVGWVTLPTPCWSAAPTVSIYAIEPAITATVNFANSKTFTIPTTGLYPGDWIQIAPTNNAGATSCAAAPSFPYKTYIVDQITSATVLTVTETVANAGTKELCRVHKIIRDGYTSKAATIEFNMVASEAPGLGTSIIQSDLMYSASCASPAFVPTRAADQVTVLKCTMASNAENTLSLSVKQNAFTDAAGQESIVSATYTTTSDRIVPTISISATDSNGAKFTQPDAAIVAATAANIGGATNRLLAKIPLTAGASGMDLFPTKTELGPPRAFTAAIVAATSGGLLKFVTKGLVAGDIVIVVGKAALACASEGTYTVESVTSTQVVVKEALIVESAATTKCLVYESLNKGADQVVVSSAYGQVCGAKGTYTITGDREGDL